MDAKYNKKKYFAMFIELITSPVSSNIFCECFLATRMCKPDSLIVLFQPIKLQIKILFLP